MRTQINGSWVIGFEDGHHVIYPDGVVVYEDDTVLHVGRNFSGRVDRRIDCDGHVVSPGFISAHMHAHVNAGDETFLDPGRPDAEGRNYLNWQASRRGSRRRFGDPELGLRFGLSRALRSGCTTVVEAGASGSPAQVIQAVEEVGLRVYTGPTYFARIVTDDAGVLETDWGTQPVDEALRNAVAWLEQIDGQAQGRLRGILCPGHTDTCSEQLLRDTTRVAAERNLPVTIHASINPVEFQTMLRTRRATPIEYLHRIGFLNERVLLAHCLFLSGHPWVNYPHGDDLALIASSGAAVAHSPLKYAHIGTVMHSLWRYLSSGVRVAIGTDFTPGDILLEMKVGMLASRIAEDSFLRGCPRDVYDAATLGGARALGRDDLGRLAPGCRADIVTVDLRKMRFGAVRDPIKAIVDNATGSDVKTVIVHGQTLVEDGCFVRLDETDFLRRVQAEAEALWADIPNWTWGARTIDEISPPSYASGGSR